MKLIPTLPYEAYQKFSAWKHQQKLLESTISQEDDKLQEVKEDIERACALIMGRWPFFGAFIYRFRVLYVPADHPQIQTMATDGKNIFVNPAFALSLTDIQTVFVFCHEILHNVMLHFARGEAKGISPQQHDTWNIALDLEINPMLVDEGILSADQLKNELKGLYEEKYLDMPAEEIFDLLSKGQKMPSLPQQLLDKMKKQQSQLPKTPPPPQPGQSQPQKPGQGQPQKPGQGQPQQGQGKPQPGSGQGEEGEGEGQGQGQGQGQGKTGSGGQSQGQGKPQPGQGGSAGVEDEDGEPANPAGNGIGGVISAEESVKIQKELGVPVEVASKKESEQIINEALSQKKHIKGSQSRGTGKGLLQRALDRFAKPQVNWKNELRRIIGKMLSQDEEYFGKKKYLHRDEYVYGDRARERELKSAIMPVDTSGSMGDDELRTVLGEVYGIIRSKKIRRTEVVYFDHGIQGHDVVKNPPKFDWSKAKGGGGTSFVEPMALIAKEYKGGNLELAVFCTDGYGDTETLTSKQKFGKRFIWLIIDNPSFVAPFGKVVHITSKTKK